MRGRRRRFTPRRAGPTIPPGAAGTGGKGPAVRTRNPILRFLAILGPGLITGASDDDPSGIGLWGMLTGPAAVWQPTSAFDTRELCVAHMSVASPGFVGKTVNTVAGSMDRGEAAYLDQGGKITFVERCLPDTVDPRAPKGK